MPRVNKNFSLRPRFGRIPRDRFAAKCLPALTGFMYTAAVREMDGSCRGRIGRAHKLERNLNMATIATLARQKDGSFSGTLSHKRLWK
jgi:hypothetical protein